MKVSGEGYTQSFEEQQGFIRLIFLSEFKLLNQSLKEATVFANFTIFPTTKQIKAKNRE
jgi:hypothetical protein